MCACAVFVLCLDKSSPKGSNYAVLDSKSVIISVVQPQFISYEFLCAVIGKLWPEIEESRKLTSPVPVDPRPDEPVFQHQVL